MRYPRAIAAWTFALALAGCGAGYYEYEEEDLSLSAPPPVEVKPAEVEKAPPPEEVEEAAVEWSAKDFVRDLPANPRGAGDGLERSRDWAAVTWDSVNTADASTWRRSMSSDDVVFAVRLCGGPYDKSAVARPARLAVAATGTLRLDVYNSTGRDIPVAFAVFSSPDRVYSESRQQAAGPGWTRLEFDLAASTYKSAASEWKHTAGLWTPEDVRELVLLFYHSGTASLAIDNLHVDQVPAPEEKKQEEPAEEKEEEQEQEEAPDLTQASAD